LIDQQPGLARPCPVLRQADVILDLYGVRCFAETGVALLGEADRRIARCGMRLHVTGLAARDGALPDRVAAWIPQLHTFPTLEAALSALVALRAGQPAASSAWTGRRDAAPIGSASGADVVGRLDAIGAAGENHLGVLAGAHSVVSPVHLGLLLSVPVEGAQGRAGHRAGGAGPVNGVVGGPRSGRRRERGSGRGHATG
jgi:hypothetical protein